MNIGIIGAGGIGQAFARHVARAGYATIISNSRGGESLAALAESLGGSVTTGSVADAANADVVFLAVPWKSLAQVAAAVSSWQGRIVIDPTNPIITPGFQVADLGDKTSSEVVAEMMSGARLVKAFNTLTPELLGADPRQNGGRRVIFFSGNDGPAKEVVGGIIERIGFAGVDLGELSVGGRLQQFPGNPLPGLNLIRLD
jgi:predicted dinucleotide-binding enzyme